MGWRASMWMACACVAVASVDCDATTRDARDVLERDGYVGVQIGPRQNGAFSFVGTNKKGLKCTGSVRVEKGCGSSSYEIQSDCRS